MKVNELKKMLNAIDFPEDATIMAKVGDDIDVVSGVWTNTASVGLLINVLHRS